MTKRTRYVSATEALRLARAASEEIAEREYPPHHGAYFKLAGLANDTDAEGRARIAAAIYKVGGLRGARALDNCFENLDGDRVSGRLAIVAEQDRELFDAIARDFGGTFPAKWIENGRNLDRPTGAQRQEIALRLNSPKRPGAVDVKDAAHLPLFVAGNEPRFL